MTGRSGPRGPGGDPPELVPGGERGARAVLLPGPGGAGTGAADREAARRGSAAQPRSERLAAELAERTADLQRVKAEYDNYRKRVQRDRLAVREIAVVNVLGRLLPVVDAIDRARECGELTGGFRQVAEMLEEQLGALGLLGFGSVGEPFDPARHEAVWRVRSLEVECPTCAEVVRPGYRVGEVLVRPAEVVVAEP